MRALKGIFLVSLLLFSACASTSRRAAYHPARPLLLPEVVQPKVGAKAALIEPNALNSQFVQGPSAHCALNNGQPTGDNEYVDWTNTGPAMRVTQGIVWIGADSAGVVISLPPGWGDLAEWISTMYIGGVADVSYLLQDRTTGAILGAWNNWDRYSNPTSAQSDIGSFSFSPYYMIINTGDVVRISIACAGPYQGDTEPIAAASMVVWWYLSAPPTISAVKPLPN